MLHNPKSGLPLAIMDGTFVTAMRTGAAGAVAAKYMLYEMCIAKLHKRILLTARENPK